MSQPSLLHATERLRWIVGITTAICVLLTCREAAEPYTWGTFLTFRNIAAVNSALLLLVVLTSAYFGIYFGRTTKGLIVGHGLDLIGYIVGWSLTIYLHPRPNVHAGVDYIKPCLSIAALGLWTFSFWNVHPDPVPDLVAIRAALREPLPKRFHRLGQALLAYLVGAFRPQRPAGALKPNPSGD